MKRRHPFNELKDMGYINGGWSNEEDFNVLHYKTEDLADFLPKKRTGEKRLLFKLMDRKFVNFTSGDGRLQGCLDAWSPEKIIRGETPECKLEVIGEWVRNKGKIFYETI